MHLSGILSLRKILYYWQVTLTALGEMFEAARSIMSWLGDCAKVSWTISFSLSFPSMFSWHFGILP